MHRRPFLAIATAALIAATAPLSAGEARIMVSEPYARSSGAMAKSGAAFMMLMNHGAEPDRLVSASSPISERVELHTHEEDANGVMRMIEVEEGFVIEAGGSRVLGRGGDHIMFIGLLEPMAQGTVVEVTLNFENAGEMTLQVPVDNKREAAGGSHDHHGHHGHGEAETPVN